MNTEKSKSHGKLTEEHIAQIKSALYELPDISLSDLIEMLSLPVTLSGLCHRLKRDNIHYKKRHIFTKKQLELIKMAFSENSGTKPCDLIARYSFPISEYQMRKKLTQMGLMQKARIVLNKQQIEQIKDVLTEQPDIPLTELIIKLALPITVAGLRNRLRKMGIPYQGQRITQPL